MRKNSQRTIRKRPNSLSGLPRFSTGMAGIAWALEDVEEAIRQYQRAGDGFGQLEEACEYDQTMFELSQIYRNQGDFEQQVDMLERASMYHTLSKSGIKL